MKERKKNPEKSYLKLEKSLMNHETLNAPEVNHFLSSFMPILSIWM